MVKARTYILSRGFTLIELLVTVVIFTLVFGGLFGAIQLTLKLISRSKASASALALANEQMEYIRSLSYNSVGTVSGIPNGPIPQNSTTTLNGIVFHERVLIQYVDSPDDGTGASDINGILADYKQVKVEYSWSNTNGTSTIFLLTNIVPPGIETTAGGGTLTVNVFDAEVQPVQGAGVRVYNTTTTSTIDTTQFTNAQGIAMFSGAPAASNYQITVTKNNFSTDKTYMATTSNPNPTTPPVAVLLSTVSTMNFQIDELSDLLVRTVAPPVYASFVDSFDDATLIASQTDTVVNGGTLVLAGGAGTYAATGNAYATATTPSSITRWGAASVSSIVPALTAYTVSVYSVSSAGVYTLIPDADLPGNSTGFSGPSINLSELSAVTYPSLALGATLTSSDPNNTPTLNEWSITYITTESAIPNIPFTLTGGKVIGTTLASAPIYKYSGSHTTDVSGERQLQDLEWDSYTFNLGSALYDIKEACGDIPYALDPGADDTLTLTLVPNETNTLRVSVVDGANNPVPDAHIQLSRPGLNLLDTTSPCGQVFFNTGMSADVDYEVEIQKAGYDTQLISEFGVGGDETLRVILSES